MFKPITITAEDIQAKAVQREAAKENVASVFKVLHGFYGNLFLSKFANGVNDEDTGADQGVESAKGVWGHGLRAYGTSVVKAALVALDDGYTASDFTVSGSAGGPYTIAVPVAAALTATGSFTGGTSPAIAVAAA